MRFRLAGGWTGISALHQSQVVEPARTAKAHLGDELAENFRRMIYTPTREAVAPARVSPLPSSGGDAGKAVSASFAKGPALSTSPLSLSAHTGRHRLVARRDAAIPTSV